MASLREIQLKHIKYFISVAQENRTDFSAIDQEFDNILAAAEGCINLEEWKLLAELTKALNDYWFFRAQWRNYRKFNSFLLKPETIPNIEERIKIVRQLAQIAESQGRYAEALMYWQELIELCQRHGYLDATTEAFNQAIRLVKIRANDDELVEWLQRGLCFAQEHYARKEEIDYLFEFAKVFEKKKEHQRAYEFCDHTLEAARELGYLTRELDALLLLASILESLNQLQRSHAFYETALKTALELDDQLRAISTREHLVRLGSLLGRNVFISYSNQDKEFVNRIANDLKDVGLPVWWDQWEIKVGDSIIQKVSDGITRSSYLVAVLSQYSIKSDWVRRELGSALMNQLSKDRNITILPILVDECEIPVLLREIKYADFRNDYLPALQDLLDAIGGIQ